MSDADKPLADLADRERNLEPQMDESEIADAAVTDMPAHERLRRFEDATLGTDVPRINGHIERGHGSRFANMADRHRKHHDALVELVAAEKAHLEAGAAETAAHARLQAAIDRANATEPKG